MLPDLFVLTGLQAGSHQPATTSRLKPCYLQPLMAWQIVLPAIDATIVHLKFVTSFHRSC